LDSLELTDGSSLEIDAVVVGIGQTANTEWLADSGLELNKGLVCDEFGQTSDPLVFGVGDAVCYRIGVDCQPNRHWTATTDQATRLAKFMTGEIEQEVYMDDHYFWSEQYGSRIQFAGKVLPSSRIVWIKGGPDEDKFVALCGSDEGVTAVFSLGSPRDFLVHSMALRSREKVALTSP
jgi:3-phenylpropionate/trans-cinnamate dioxygenase ferredoxin reductase subunit